MADQHGSLSPERWARFSRDQQLLMIANEMHRATRALELNEPRSVTLCYERVLRLADLTAGISDGLSFRRELLRWRGLVAELYVDDLPNAAGHRAALGALLGFAPAVWAQREFLLSQASG
jgi:hypothetical protein